MKFVTLTLNWSYPYPYLELTLTLIWHRDVGDRFLMFVPSSWCWRRDLSPTHLVTNIRHQHWCNRTKLDITKEWTKTWTKTWTTKSGRPKRLKVNGLNSLWSKRLKVNGSDIKNERSKRLNVNVLKDVLKNERDESLRSRNEKSGHLLVGWIPGLEIGITFFCERYFYLKKFKLIQWIMPISEI